MTWQLSSPRASNPRKNNVFHDLVLEVTPPPIISATSYWLYGIAQPSVEGDYSRGHGARIIGAISGAGFPNEIFMNFIHPIISIITEACCSIGAQRIRFSQRHPEGTWEELWAGA